MTFRCFEGKAKPGEPFWTFRDAAETGGDPELEFYGVISEWSWLDDEVTPKKFKDQLYKTGKGGPITVRMDSPGGDPVAASTISSIISSYPGKVTMQIDGEAASAAVLVALAASHIRIQDTAYMMIHDPAVIVWMAALNIETLGRLRDALKSIKQGLMSSYAARTGLSVERLSRMMTNTTWMSAQEAVEFGFADEVVKGGQERPARQFENILRNYANVPAALLNAAVDDLSVENDEEGTTQPVEIEAEAPETEPQAVPDGPEREQTESVAAQVRPTAPYADRLALAANRIQSTQGVTMYVRDLINKRATLLDEAQALVNQADAEGRDLNDAERTRFTALMGDETQPGEVGELDQQIERIQTERERLRAAAGKTFNAGNPTQKPDSDAKTVLKRAEFEALSAGEQAAFVKAGGKIED